MNIQPTAPTPYKTSFKSVYHAYYWVKQGGKTVPVFDVASEKGLQGELTVKRLQRELTGILNNTSNARKRYPIKTLRKIWEFVGSFDGDYKLNKVVCSVPTEKGGVVEAWNGTISRIDSSMCIISGKDAIDFRHYYGKPIGYAKSGNIPEELMDVTPDLESANFGYHCGCEMYKEYTRPLMSKDGKSPMCLHVYLEQCKGKMKGYVVTTLEFDKLSNIESKFLDNVTK